MRRYSFSKKKRLGSNRQFRSVMIHGQKRFDKGLIMFVASNDCSFARFGISVSKACGCAVKRNRIKRLFRESFRLIQNDIESGFDYLFIVSPRWKLLKSNQNKKELKKISMQNIKEIMLKMINKQFK